MTLKPLVYGCFPVECHCPVYLFIFKAVHTPCMNWLQITLFCLFINFYFQSKPGIWRSLIWTAHWVFRKHICVTTTLINISNITNTPEATLSLPHHQPLKGNHHSHLCHCRLLLLILQFYRISIEIPMVFCRNHAAYIFFFWILLFSVCLWGSLLWLHVFSHYYTGLHLFFFITK